MRKIFTLLSMIMVCQAWAANRTDSLSSRMTHDDEFIVTKLTSGDWFDSSYQHKYNNIISFSTGYSFASNAITNHFALEYLLNRFIDENEKNKVSSRLSELNRIGAEFNNEIRYTHFSDTIFKMPNSFFSVTLSNKIHINSRFGSDVFELYFRGNKNYAGKKAEVGKFIYKQLVYQQLNFTFGHNYNRGENNYGYSAGISLNKGQRLYEITADRASIYTEEIGMYLDLDAQIKIHQSDSSKNDLAAFKGFGVSGDFSYLWTDRNKNTLTLSAENVGFIKWNRRSTDVNADTAFRFEGIDVSYLFDLSDTIKKTISLDSSLVEPYLTRAKKTYTSLLPALLKVSYIYILTPGLMDLEAEGGYLLFASANPFESVKFNYTIKQKHKLGVQIMIGGYGGPEMGLSYEVKFLNHWLFLIESDHISSMLFPNSGGGSSAFVSLSAYF